jgi:hypothetical protein
MQAMNTLDVLNKQRVVGIRHSCQLNGLQLSSRETSHSAKGQEMSAQVHDDAVNYSLSVVRRFSTKQV